MDIIRRAYSIYSKTKKHAMLNIFPFCIGILIAYYFAAFVTNGVYSKIFIIGWTVFALLSPIFAYFTWMTKEKGVFPKIIGVGIVLVSILSSIILFDKLRVYDFIIDGIMIYFCSSKSQKMIQYKLKCSVCTGIRSIYFYEKV